MDHIVVMGILQGCRDLLDVGGRRFEREVGAAGVMLPHSSSRGIFHDEKGISSLDGKIEHAHDVGMRQASERLGLGEELFDILVRKRGVKHFERGAIFQVQVLS